MLVSPELSRQIETLLPQLQAVVKSGLTETGKLRLPKLPEEAETEISLNIGDINLLIRKTRETTEVINFG